MHDYKNYRSNDKLFEKRFPKINIEKQHKRGKLHAIERVNYFFDGFFEELMEYVSGDKDMKHEPVLTGWGFIGDRKIFFYSQDFTIKGGSVGKYHALKIYKILDMAIKSGNIIVSFIDSGGAKIEEGVDSLDGYSKVFRKIVEASGWIPQISLIMGPSAGGAVYSPALSDFICMVKGTSFMFVNGPKVVERVTGRKVSNEELGGSEVHNKISGVSHFSAEDEYKCMDIAKRLISYLPSNSLALPPRLNYKGSKELVQDLDYYMEQILNNNVFNVSHVIEYILDEDSFLEVHKDFAKNIVVGFGRLYGDVVGIVANNRFSGDGRLDSDAGDKASRFIRFCDAFNIPILTIVDTPGFILGLDEEKKGIIRHVAKILYAFAESTVPIITLIIGNAYGGGYISMGSKSLGADFVFSWPSASIAVMSVEEASNILHGKKEEREVSLEEFKRAYREDIESPYNAASKGYIDKIIDPEKTRVIIKKTLDVLEGKTTKLIRRKKHGVSPV